MWPHSDRLAAALRGPHRVHHRIEWSPDWATWHPLTVADYGVTQDRTANCRWSLSAKFPTGQVELGIGGLHEFGCRMRLSIGIQALRADVEWLPYGRYRVETIDEQEPAGTFSVTAKSLEVAIADATFPAPRSMPDQTNDSKRTQLERLVTEAVPDAVFVWDDRLAWWDPMLPVIEDKARWDLVGSNGKLSIPASMGAELSTDASGAWQIRRTPSLDDAAVWTVDRGDGGVLVSTGTSRGRRPPKNLWVVTGQLNDGRTVVGPSYAWDRDPTSLTFAGPDPVGHPELAGRYGVRTGYYTSPLLGTLEATGAAARARLADSLGTRRTLSFTTRFHPGMAAGDVVMVEEREGLRPHLIDTIAYSPSRGTADVATRTPGPQAQEGMA